MTDAIGVAVIGFGFMGRTHAAGFERARLAGVKCELRAICAGGPVGNDDKDALGRPLPFDPADVPLVTNVDSVLEREDVHAVSICTYTDTHVPLVQRALAAGKHVLVEKPVALSTDELRPLLEAASAKNTLCAPALCMRYWPGWPWLRDRVRDGSFGAVQSATFERVSAVPGWSDFYADTDRSGGALFDLHIHDADFVRWCFGQPVAVSSTGDLNTVNTSYIYPNREIRIDAAGTWSADPDTPFRMIYNVTFEEAVASFDAGRETPVRLERNGETEIVTLPAETAYDAQARDFIEAIIEKRLMRATLDDAFQVTRILEAEHESMRTTKSMAIDP